MAEDSFPDNDSSSVSLGVIGLFLTFVGKLDFHDPGGE